MLGIDKKRFNTAFKLKGIMSVRRLPEEKGFCFCNVKTKTNANREGSVKCMDLINSTLPSLNYVMQFHH